MGSRASAIASFWSSRSLELLSLPQKTSKKYGSALKFGMIAAGEADLYPRFGPKMEWDTAAGQAILEATGGRVETLAGAPLAYGKPGLKNKRFLAWGAASVR
jgi:3'(2'), 5'-bisphosphate nucleotidase